MSIIIILTTSNAFVDTGLLLIILIISLVSFKGMHSKWMTTVQMIAIILATYQNPMFAYFFGMVIYSLIMGKNFLAVLPLLLASYIFSSYIEIEILLPTMLLCGYLSYNVSVVNDKALKLAKKYDDERMLRSSAESHNQLTFDTIDKVEQFAKLKERNRIAMDIHDNIGHSIAGVLMQFQAAKKIDPIDKNKADKLYEASTKRLAETLGMLREIVHDLKPANLIGVEYIKEIVDDFKFCDIDATYTGNFTNISAVHIEIVTTILKEALTNIIKHSKATKVKLTLDSNKKYLRLFIKDNGLGCEDITENLGIRSMRARVENVGGNFSIGNNNGIVIVCVLFMGNSE
ncbi:sensor histidine kinase [bacterium AH-315-K05]|nr:sensor histidine kinase [bacterium AH-315-K05]